MFLVGLTGGIATGKSMVSFMLKENNIPVIDADLIAKDIVQPGKPAYNKIIKTFGQDILQSNGEIDRIKLGAIVFADADKRRLINSITHPIIYKEIRNGVFYHFYQGTQFVVLDLPLLYESGKLLSFLYKTIVVTCSSSLQLKRLCERNEFNENEAKARIEAQMPLSMKEEKADFIIENSASFQDTRKQVDDICRLLRASNRHYRNRAIIYIIIAGSLLILGLIFYLI